MIRNDRTGVIVEVSDRNSINGVAFWRNGKDGIATLETAGTKTGTKVEEKFAGKAAKVEEAGTWPQTTSPIVISGNRAIDKAQSYESGVRRIYGNTPYAERQYTALVDGQRVNGVADSVAIIGGKKTAVEAKFVENWESSLRNPTSSSGSRSWSVAEQTKMVEQAKKYSAGFDGGVIYHTNSLELANHYSKLFAEAGVKKFKFVITPTKN